MAEKQGQTATEEDEILPDQKPSEGLESSYYTVISQTTADGRIMIGPNLEIFPDKECPDFASQNTRAYEAKDRRLQSEQFVLLCGRDTVPRVTAIGSYKTLKNPGILKLVEAGIVNWPSENRQRLALIFEKPVGKKVLASPEEKPYRIPEERLIQAVIEPAVRALLELRDIDLVHGAINLENIFIIGAEGRERIILGECLSSAPSLRQHVVYEVPSRGAAQASGRGPGTVKDDLYALGVCVAMIAHGENLMSGMTPQQIIYEKIEHGSYATIVGGTRIPGGISEFLRGVLNDDEAQRWDIETVMQWLEGRRLGPRQSRTILRASRPLVFREQKYWDLRSVAQAFSEDIPAAVAELDNSEFEAWRKRNFEDLSLDLRFEKVWAREKEVPREKLISNVCMALDPLGPVRYKGLSIYPAGFGVALAQAMAKNEDIQVYGELVSQSVFSAWLNEVFEEVSDAAGLLSIFERCRSALTQKMPGYGIERVLYILNMDVACMSPLLKDYFVLTPESLLLALEDIAKKPERPETPFDRHILAMISVREPKVIDTQLSYVNAQSKGLQIMGILKTLESIQRKFNIGPVPGVCNWLCSMMEPAIELLNDRALRQLVSKKVNSVKDAGNLTTLLDIVGDHATIQDDMQRFVLARQKYRALGGEKVKIEGSLKKRKDFGSATGRNVAMVFSAFLSVTVITSYIVLHLLRFL